MKASVTDRRRRASSRPRHRQGREAGREDELLHGPSGLPEPDRPEEELDQPLGVTRAAPDGESDRPRGPEAMPGIPSRGEPPTAG